MKRMLGQIKGVRGAVLLSAFCATVAVLSGVGCAAAGVVAIAAKGVEESRPKKVKAEYTGLAGKSFAVVVSADRSVQSEFPALVTELTARINDRLWTNSGAAAGVPAQELLKYLYENPSWTARPYAELAQTLSVERLVIVDLNEFRLHDPGNRYLWDGVAAGTVSVIEADGSLADEFIFQRAIRVGFPDVTGVEQDKFTAQQVSSVIMARFVNRASWLFYDHEEEAQIPY